MARLPEEVVASALAFLEAFVGATRDGDDVWRSKTTSGERRQVGVWRREGAVWKPPDDGSIKINVTGRVMRVWV